MDLANNVDFQKETLVSFEENFNTYFNTLNAASNRLELKKCIALEFENLTKSFVSLGDEINETFLKSEDTHLVNYVLSEDFKTVMILHRDVFLELNKVSIAKQENRLNDDQISNHYQSAKEILEKKLKDFNRLLLSEKNKVTESTYIKNIAQKITLQKNPWAIYRSQYETITNQIKKIEEQKILAFTTITIFENLKQVVFELTKTHTILLENITKSTNYILENTKENKDNTKLLAYIDEQLDRQSNIENKQSSFSETVNNQINQLRRIEIPMHAVNGLLSIRDIDLKKRCQKWFDYQILPEFMDLIGLEAGLINKYRLNLVNLKNSLQLTKETQGDVRFNTILTSLSHLVDDIKDIKIRCEILSKSLKDKVNNELLLTNLVQGKHFLDVTLNSSLNTDSHTVIKNIKNKIQKGILYFNSQYKKSLHYESISNMELSTQCIAHRMFQDESRHYDSLFLNKRFIGDLFLVARKNQENKLKLILDQWNQGFNKSVLVSGDRLSGRSTFLDYAAKKFFGKDIVVLNPNSHATIDGRKFITTNDLKEALIYVKNNNIKSTRPIILIDDLERWRDDKHSLLYNIRALINFIETESDDSFVMASATKMMVNHLDHRLNFSNSFSHTISCDDADENEIVEAILLRHGAAHRDLITEDLKVITNNKLRILARKLCKQNAYNFGNTLQSWTYNTFVQDDEKVLFKDSYYEFLDFFTSQEIIIIKQALLYTYITEYGIKNVTAAYFETEFKGALRRLMNVKVLMRNTKGSLYINPVVVNDVTRIITNKLNP